MPDLDTVTTNARRCKGDFTRDTVCIVFSRTTFGSELSSNKTMYERAGDSLGSVFYCDVIASVLLTLLLCNLTVMLCACRQLPPFLLLLQVCTRTRHSCMCSSGFVCLTTSLAQRVALQGGVATDCY